MLLLHVRSFLRLLSALVISVISEPLLPTISKWNRGYLVVKKREKPAVRSLQFLGLHSTALQFREFIGTLFFLGTANGVVVLFCCFSTEIVRCVHKSKSCAACWVHDFTSLCALAAGQVLGFSSVSLVSTGPKNQMSASRIHYRAYIARVCVFLFNYERSYVI